MTTPDPAAQGGGTTEPQSGEGAGDAGQQGDGTQSGSAGQDAGGQGATQETVSKADFEALMARMRAADQRASKAETDLRALRDKDLPELDKLKREAAEAAAARDALEQERNELRISTAFLTDNTYDWQNPASALRLLDRSKLQVGNDGEVLGMKDALKALATSDAYLLKPKAPETTPPTPPGTPPANGGGQGSGNTTRTQLEKRFPNLRTRQRLT